MFERYVENARRTIHFSRYEAAQRGSSNISPEHILLGLLRDAPTPLRGIVGVSEQQVQNEISAYLPQHEKHTTPTDICLSQESQHVLAVAEAEADRLAHRRIDNYHLLLGLCMDTGFASQVLRRNGVSAESIREQLLTLHKATEEPAPSPANSADLSPADRAQHELQVRVIGLLKVKDYQGALKVVDDTIADPSLDRNRTTRGLAQIASTIARIVGDFDRARRYCELRVACDPEDAMALYVLADCLDHQGEADQAMKIARKSYELSLARRGAQGEGLVELIETRFPRVTLGA